MRRSVDVDTVVIGSGAGGELRPGGRTRSLYEGLGPEGLVLLRHRRDEIVLVPSGGHLFLARRAPA